ncbi:UNVERIFIED_CONTAM: hypothetical protein GTU68_060414 [Idotea baltica]|nr:hypothetical protein [Idotea baltica]
MTKPFSSRELIARIKTVLRRTCRDPNEQALSIDGLILDPISHRVTSHLKPIKIGPTEYRLLQFFMTHPEQAYTRNQLIEAIWNEKAYIEERTIDVHIRRLRKILGEKHNSLIQTVRGIGYRFSTKN